MQASDLSLYYNNFLSGDEIVWHVANAVKHRLIDKLFCSYRIYISGSVALYSRAELSAHVLAESWGCFSLLLCVCYVTMLW